MEFGKVPENVLKNIDFILPEDPEVNDTVLKKVRRQTKFYIGCAKWGRRDWIGKLYPHGAREKDFLEYYARLFNAIEFNSLYYGLPSRQTVRNWKSKVPQGFLFCPKFTQSITHDKRLRDTEAEVDAFLSTVHELGDALGPVFLLPHPSMGPESLPLIRSFIENLPEDTKLFLELRHEDWYREEGYHYELYTFLKKQRCGTVITDAAGRRDCVHMHLSTPECFIRFVGNALHPTDYTRIDDWVRRIGHWMNEGLETCYFFMHQHDELHSPELIRYFIDRLNEHCGTSVQPPVLLNEQQNLLF